jgi:hypothetical protein
MHICGGWDDRGQGGVTRLQRIGKVARDALSALGLAAAQTGPFGAEGSASPEPGRALSLADFESLARDYVSHGAWARIQGGAADEITLRWNREAYEHIRLRPRVLVDVSKLDTRVTLLGQELPFPIVLSPTGAQGFVHPDGELAVARGAGAAQAILVISSTASMRLEDIARAATGTVWFQLYVQKDRGFTRDLVQRAQAAGCRALCVTVDCPPRARATRSIAPCASYPSVRCRTSRAGNYPSTPR